MAQSMNAPGAAGSRASTPCGVYTEMVAPFHPHPSRHLPAAMPVNKSSTARGLAWDNSRTSMHGSVTAADRACILYYTCG